MYLFGLFTVGAVNLLFTTLVLAQASSGVVQRVIDGDTIVASPTAGCSTWS